MPLNKESLIKLSKDYKIISQLLSMPTKQKLHQKVHLMGTTNQTILIVFIFQTVVLSLSQKAPHMDIKLQKCFEIIYYRAFTEALHNYLRSLVAISIKKNLNIISPSPTFWLQGSNSKPVARHRLNKHRKSKCCRLLSTRNTRISQP